MLDATREQCNAERYKVYVFQTCSANLYPQPSSVNPKRHDIKLTTLFALPLDQASVLVGPILIIGQFVIVPYREDCFAVQ